MNGFGVFHIDNDFGGNDKFTSLDAEDDSATRSPCLTAPTVGVASHIAEDLPASLRGDFGVEAVKAIMLRGKREETFKREI